MWTFLVQIVEVFAYILSLLGLVAIWTAFAEVGSGTRNYLLTGSLSVAALAFWLLPAFIGTADCAGSEGSVTMFPAMGSLLLLCAPVIVGAYYVLRGDLEGLRKAATAPLARRLGDEGAEAPEPDVVDLDGVETHHLGGHHA